MKNITIIISLLVLFSGCLKDENLKTSNITYLPQQLNDGWDIDNNTAAVFNIDSFNKVISNVYSNNDFLLIHSMVIIKDGKLMAEAYPRTPSDRDTPPQLWSTTKSFISILTGIAYDKGFIHNVSDQVLTYIPEYIQYASPELKPLTIEECLTMRSGIDYDNDGWEEEELLALVPDDLTRYILQRPMKNIPGQVAIYKNSDPQLMVKVVSDATDTDLVDFARQNLFAPLGITNFYWSRNKDNTPYGGFGLWMTPRDLAKVGQMILNHGSWNGNQILSPYWIKEATSGKTDLYGFKYGYFFWSDPQKNYFWTWGAGGQYIFMVPHKNLVVVITSEQHADNANTTIDQAVYLVDHIIESIKK